MDTETLLKTAAVTISFIAAVFGILKYFLDLTTNSKNKHREEYKFAKDFFADQINLKPMEPYLLEKGYMAIAGNSDLKTYEIEYLLTLTGAATALRQYSRGKKYLKQLPQSGSLIIEFKDKYKNPTYRYILEKLYESLYYVLFMFALVPLFLNLSLFKAYSMYAGVFAIFSIPLIIFAVMSAIESVRISLATELVKNQKIHIEQVSFPELAK